MCTNVEPIISKYGEQIKLTKVLLIYIYMYIYIYIIYRYIDIYIYTYIYINAHWQSFRKEEKY